jgi:replicative DNA helicase
MSQPTGSHSPAVPAAAAPPLADGQGYGSGGGFAPPNNLPAEEAVLGACMLRPEAVDTARGVLEPGDFYRPAHETVWRALVALQAEKAPTDPIALGERLGRAGDLPRVGGPEYLHRLVQAGLMAPAVENVAYYAAMIRRTAELRALHTQGLRTVQQALTADGDPEAIRAQIEAEVRAGRERSLASGTSRLMRHIVNGWDFVTKTGADKEPLWGTREHTAWAPGESLMIVGPPGVGKTSIAHQVVLARIGIRQTALGLPVAPAGRVLYLALDRPMQIARAMARTITASDEALLRERLVVWEGPLPATLDREPDLLAELAAAHKADTIVIDSLKDAISTMVDDALAVAYNNARSRALREGVQIMDLHHQRKSGQEAVKGGTRTRPKLDQVYGSTWLTSGVGSVLFVNGEAGDPAVTIHHLKTVTGEVGPLDVIHDHVLGTSHVEDTLEPITLLRNAATGMTVRDLASAMTGESNPSRGAVEKARRHLKTLVDSGLAIQEGGAAGGRGGGVQTRYRPSHRHITSNDQQMVTEFAMAEAIPEQQAIPLTPVPAAEPAERDPRTVAAMQRSPAATTTPGADRSRDRTRDPLAAERAHDPQTVHAPRQNRR